VTLLPGEFHHLEISPLSDLQRWVDSRWALPQISSFTRLAHAGILTVFLTISVYVPSLPNINMYFLMVISLLLVLVFIVNAHSMQSALLICAPQASMFMIIMAAHMFVV